jgi:hypothetical protein
VGRVEGGGQEVEEDRWVALALEATLVDLVAGCGLVERVLVGDKISLVISCGW